MVGVFNVQRCKMHIALIFPSPFVPATRRGDLAHFLDGDLVPILLPVHVNNVVYHIFTFIRYHIRTSRAHTTVSHPSIAIES